MSFSAETRDQSSAISERASLAWLLASAAAGALAAIVLGGIVAGRLGLPLVGWLLLAAAPLGMLRPVLALARGRWSARPIELAAALAGLLSVLSFVLVLAWPALLPLGLSVDAVHHAQLAMWIADHAALPQPTRDLQGMLGEMVAYPVGMVLVALAAAQATGRSPVEVLYPTAALVGALIAALVVTLSSAAGSNWRSGRNGNPLSPIFQFLALLIGPLLLLAHRTYLLEAYIDHSYYTMLLGVLLVLLVAGHLIAEPRLSWGGLAQIGLALAALMGTYPLWVPLPAGLAIAAIVRERARGRRTTNDEGGTFGRWSPVAGRWSPVAGRLALALGPALALALLDVLPRMRIGQSVLEHQGLVTMPTARRVMPLLLALPLAPLLLRGQAGRRLLALAGFAGLASAALATASWLGLAAVYHSYKILFILTPLSAAIASAGALRLTLSPAARAPLNQSARAEQAKQPEGLMLQASFIPFAANLRSRSLWAGAIVLALALSGSFQVIPPRAIQILNPDVVAAASWLRANSPKEAVRALVVGAPTGPLSYWLQIGLLGQRRDRAHSAVHALTGASPSPESWLVDTHLAPVAIAPNLEAPLPGMAVLARFGQAAVVRRDAPLDLEALNPLTIRYKTFFENDRLKTAIELQRPLAGQLPLLELRLYHAGAPLVTFALPPEQARTRPQYLGADLLPATLGGEGYVNSSFYPTFAAPDAAPTGALTLTLRLAVGGNAVDERLLATFERTAGGRIVDLATSSGELIYLQRGGSRAWPSQAGGGADFAGALRLVGWQVPAHASAREPLAIDLGWQAPRPLDRSLYPELVLRDAAGRIVASNLAAPQDGFYPTWRWRPGELVSERRRIALPADTPPGDYRVAVRVQDFAGRRALIADDAGPDGLVELGVVRIEP